MKKVGISAELERRLRKGEGIEDVIKLLDEHKSKRVASSVPGGLGYKELVALFRFHLGHDLVLPPSPSPAYVVKIVRKASELGIKEEHVQQIAQGIRRNCYPPYTLEYCVYRGYGFIHAAEHTEEGTDTNEVHLGQSAVVVGRGDHNESELGTGGKHE